MSKDIKFKIKGDCIVKCADREPTVEEIQVMLQMMLLAEDIEANVIVSDLEVLEEEE